MPAMLFPTSDARRASKSNSRIGDYRLILDVDWERRVLIVLTLGHRSTVYR